MTTAVEIRDDPAHPEGGHALVLFRGARGFAGPAYLEIELLTDGFVYRGPRQIEVLGNAIDEGLVFPVGGGQFDTLDIGIAVCLAVPQAGLKAEVLWPALTPMRAGSRRVPMRNVSARRAVVEGSGVTIRSPLEPQRPVDNGRKNPLQTLHPMAMPLTEPEPKITTGGSDATPRIGEPVGPKEPGTEMFPKTANKPAGPQDDREVRPSLRDDGFDRSPVRRWPALAAGLILGSGLGAAVVSIVWMTRPDPQPRIVTVTAEPRLPSPYEMLHDLSNRSPNGTPVDMADSANFLSRSRSAGNNVEESSFWSKWAARTLLVTKSNGAAATLSDFATHLAIAHVDQPTLAAARFIWEMTAIADDCAGMDNIAKALTASGERDAVEQAAIWQSRGRQCVDRAAVSR